MACKAVMAAMTSAVTAVATSVASSALSFCDAGSESDRQRLGTSVQNRLSCSFSQESGQASAAALGSSGMAASAASHRPIKGILKNKSSTASSVAASSPQSGGNIQEVQRKKSQKWDESNILATHRPAYRDYDLMKINEPSSPHCSQQDYGEDPVTDLDAKDTMSPDVVAKKLAASGTSQWSRRVGEPDSDGAHSSKTFFDAQEKQRQFEMKRKLHHNEGLNIQLARRLISNDLQHEKDEDDNGEAPLGASEHSTALEESSDEVSTSDELQSQPSHS